MQSISNTLKETFRSDNFQPKGYIELLHINEELEQTASFSTSVALDSKSNSLDLFDGDRQGIQYATLENGYLKMNGQTCLYNSTMPKTGIISDKIFSELGSFTFNITNSNTTTKVEGITLYFKDNNPLSITAVVNGNAYNLSGNKPIYNIEFGEEQTVSNVVITVNSVEYPERRVRLTEIDYGTSSLFQENSLMNFNIIEQVSRITENLPANEINIQLNNFENIFNPINPSGLVPYMNENLKIRAYIGAVTSKGIEYCSMGTYRLYDWKNTNDYETQIVGRNIIQNVNQEEVQDVNGELFQSSFTRDKFISYMNNNYNYMLDVKSDWNNLLTFYLKDRKLSDFLKDISVSQNAIIYGDRNEGLIIKTPNTLAVDTLNLRTQLLQEPLYTVQDYYDNVNVITTWANTNIASTEESQILNSGTITLTSQSQRVMVLSSLPMFIYSPTVEQTGGSSISLVSWGLYMIFLNITGNIGDTVTYTVKGPTGNYAENNASNMFGTGSKTLEVNIPFVKYPATVSSVGNYLLNNSYKYKVKTEYTGLPYLEAGDTVSIETRFGYKDMFIEKHEITFDGGIKGTIEGVSNV